MPRSARENQIMREILEIECSELPTGVLDFYASLRGELAAEGKYLQNPKYGSFGIPFRLWTPEARTILAETPGVYIHVDASELETAIATCGDSVKNLLVDKVDDTHLGLLAKFPSLERLELNGDLTKSERWYIPVSYPLIQGLRSLTIRFGNMYDPDLQRLVKDSPLLEELSLTKAPLSSNTAIIIADHLPLLKRVDLSNTRTDDTGVFCLGHDLEGLESLELVDTRVSDASLRYVARKAKSLKSLNLTKTSITSRTLEALRDNTVLQELVIYECDVGDEGAYAIANSAYSKKLKRLVIGHTGMSSKGLGEIGRGCPNLRSLSLGGLPVGDEGIQAVLEGANQIMEFDVSGCGLTDKGAKVIYDRLKGPGVLYISYKNEVSKGLLDLLATKFLYD